MTSADAEVKGVSDPEPSDDDLAVFHQVLKRLRALDIDDERRRHAEHAVNSLTRDTRRRRRRREPGPDTDAPLVAATATGAADRAEDVPVSTRSGTVGYFHRPRRCYVCKAEYWKVHALYHALCPSCAAANAARRDLTTDLTGRRALLTGGRVKIGFHLALKLLRDGAEVHLTTRFPLDAHRRFGAAPDSGDWRDRLRIIGIDLRDPRQVLALCQGFHAEHGSLDILINNAAQTIRRPAASYAVLAAAETNDLPPGVVHTPGFRVTTAVDPAWTLPAITPAAEPSTADRREAAAATVTPRAEAARVDESGLLPDPAASNSWSLSLGELDPAEVLEAQLVNSLAPALLCDRLLPLLRASTRARRYIVNVSAVEGRFAVRNKTPNHPHTNMAKAALNMLTRTSGEALAAEGIHMCSVDTGWITDENPEPRKADIAAAGFRTPLDVVDGAARVYDPIVRGEAGNPVSGVFLKDYREAQW